MNGAKSKASCMLSDKDRGERCIALTDVGIHSVVVRGRFTCQTT